MDSFGGKLVQHLDSDGCLGERLWTAFPRVIDVDSGTPMGSEGGKKGNSKLLQSDPAGKRDLFFKTPFMPVFAGCVSNSVDQRTILHGPRVEIQDVYGVVRGTQHRERLRHNRLESCRSAWG